MINMIRDAMPSTDPDESRDWSLEEKVQHYSHCYKALPPDGEDPHSNPELVQKATLQLFGTMPDFEYFGDDANMNNLRYPSVINIFPYKSVWKDMLHVDVPRYIYPITILTLLEESGGTELSLSQLGQILGCTMVHNMGANMIYIGGKTQLNVDNAHKFLRSLLVHKVRLVLAMFTQCTFADTFTDQDSPLGCPYDVY